LLVLAGAKPVSPAVYRLRAGFQAASGERQEYLRVRVEYGARADPAMVLLPNQSSGVGSSLSVADGLAILPAFTSVERGDILDFIPLNELIG
jgi:molybdopterin molybdotransferase